MNSQTKTLRSVRSCAPGSHPEWHLGLLGHQILTGSAQEIAPPERSGSCHSSLPAVRALESTILISHQPPAPERSLPFPREEQFGAEQNTTTDSRRPESVSRDLGNAAPGIQAKLFYRSRSHARIAPGLLALKGRASRAPTSRQHQVCNTRGPPRSRNTWPGPAHNG